MIRFIAPYIFRDQTYRQYCDIADLHTLQFTVTHALGFSISISRILATDLSQSHCNFNSHIKSSWRSLVPFLPVLFNHFRLPSLELDPIRYPCGSGVEYLHRDPASRRRRRKGKSQTWDSKIWSRVPRNSDPRKTALARNSSIYKRQTRPLVRDGAPTKIKMD
jgi:hypothetical protein